jgi:hypothetical protein
MEVPQKHDFLKLKLPYQLKYIRFYVSTVYNLVCGTHSSLDLRFPQQWSRKESSSGDMTPSSPLKVNHSLRWICHLLQGQTISQTRNNRKARSKLRCWRSMGDSLETFNSIRCITSKKTELFGIPSASQRTLPNIHNSRSTYWQVTVIHSITRPTSPSPIHVRLSGNYWCSTKCPYTYFSYIMSHEEVVIERVQTGNCI